MELIDILNKNSGLISAVATVILVVITAWYAFITKKILKSNEESTRELIRPYIIANVEPRDYFIMLRITNIGKRPAQHITVRFCPSLEEIDKLVADKNDFTDHKPMLNQEFMPPGFEISTTLILMDRYVTNEELQRVFRVELKYFDSKEVEYNDIYTLDLSNVIWKKKTIEFSDNYYFQEIDKRLREIREILKSKR